MNEEEVVKLQLQLQSLRSDYQQNKLKFEQERDQQMNKLKSDKGKEIGELARKIELT